MAGGTGGVGEDRRTFAGYFGKGIGNAGGIFAVTFVRKDGHLIQRRCPAEIFQPGDGRDKALPGIAVNGGRLLQLFQLEGMERHIHLRVETGVDIDPDAGGVFRCLSGKRGFAIGLDGASDKSIFAFTADKLHLQPDHFLRNLVPQPGKFDGSPVIFSGLRRKIPADPGFPL